MAMRRLIQQLREQQFNQSLSNQYSLQWRQKTLIIRPAAAPDDALAITVQDLEWVTARIVRSPVKRVSLDRHFTAEELTFWATACGRAGKQVYLSLPSTPDLPMKRKPLRWQAKWLIDRVTSIVIFALISPLLFGLAFWIYAHAAGHSLLVSEWQVGERGRLYRALYFRTRVGDRQFPGSRWIRRYRLDRWPKLINVMRGEMSLVGACPRRLGDVPAIDGRLHRQLNSLPGMTGTWHLEKYLDATDHAALLRIDRQYIWNWSLRSDFKLLLISTAKIWVAEQF
jgi:lipopolysaccharide/colanic/teichoic acid biosynthesis glycosyltransferase